MTDGVETSETLGRSLRYARPTRTLQGTSAAPLAPRGPTLGATLRYVGARTPSAPAGTSAPPSHAGNLESWRPKVTRSVLQIPRFPVRRPQQTIPVLASPVCSLVQQRRHPPQRLGQSVGLGRPTCSVIADASSPVADARSLNRSWHACSTGSGSLSSPTGRRGKPFVLRSR